MKYNKIREKKNKENGNIIHYFVKREARKLSVVILLSKKRLLSETITFL